MTKEHLGLALALKIPVVIVVTKVDICPENVLKQTLEDIQRILKVRGVRKMSMIVKNEEDMITCIKNIHNDRIVPIFLLSSVTGKNVDILRQVRSSIIVITLYESINKMLILCCLVSQRFTAANSMGPVS